MKKVKLVSGIDYNNNLGLFLKKDTIHTNNEGIDAINSGILGAHDILEHNPSSTYVGIANELQALGAALHVREHKMLDISSDISGLCFDVLYNLESTEVCKRRLGKFYRDISNEYIIEKVCGFIKKGVSDFINEVNFCDTNVENRRLVKNLIRNMKDHIVSGYIWANNHYESGFPCELSDSMIKTIDRLMLDVEFVGQEFILCYDSFDCNVSYIETTKYRY